MDADLDLSFGSENRMFDCNVEDDTMSTPSITKCILPTTTAVSKRNLSMDGSFDLRLEQQWGDMSEVSIEVTPVAARTLALEADEEVVEVMEDEAPNSAERRRKQREEEEASERLAWELMQQEQEDLYNMQLQYIQQQATTMSADDFNALQQVLREAGAEENAPTEDVAQEGDAGDEEGADGDAEGEEQWDYERLLALGQALGDVKTERWRLQSQKLIDSLPEMRYSRAKLLHGGRQGGIVDLTTPPQARDKVVMLSPLPPLPPLVSSSTAATPRSPGDAVCDRCSICMDFFSDDDLVKVLPCSHCFHPPCAQGWIRDHNSCAYCTVKIVRTPVPASTSTASIARV